MLIGASPGPVGHSVATWVSVRRGCFSPRTLVFPWARLLKGRTRETSGPLGRTSMAAFMVRLIGVMFIFSDRWRDVHNPACCHGVHNPLKLSERCPCASLLPWYSQSPQVFEEMSTLQLVAMVLPTCSCFWRDVHVSVSYHGV